MIKLLKQLLPILRCFKQKTETVVESRVAQVVVHLQCRFVVETGWVPGFWLRLCPVQGVRWQSIHFHTCVHPSHALFQIRYSDIYVRANGDWAPWCKAPCGTEGIESRAWRHTFSAFHVEFTAKVGALWSLLCFPGILYNLQIVCIRGSDPSPDGGRPSPLLSAGATCGTDSPGLIDRCFL